MGSIRHWPRTSTPPLGSIPDDLDELRVAFHARIQSERIRLVALSAALASSELDPGDIYDDLTSRAHRLQSGAETLELTEVAAAANSLKLAAWCASLSHADNTDTPVWTALVALVSAMGSLASS